MDQQLSADIQDSIVKIEAKLKELQGLSDLNKNLGQANQALADAAQTLSSASGQLPPTLTEFKTLSDRLAQLTRSLESSDLTVLADKVGRLESDFASVSATLNRLSAETGGKLQAIGLEVADINNALGRSADEASGKLDALSTDIDNAKGQLKDLQIIIRKTAAQNTLLVLATGVAVIGAIFAVRLIG